MLIAPMRKIVWELDQGQHAMQQVENPTEIGPCIDSLEPNNNWFTH